MPVNDLTATEYKRLGSAKTSVATGSTANFDFGTPNDLNLAALSDYKHGDKILVVFTATTAGTTDSVTFSIQDAPDSAGSIGSVATAITDGTLTGGPGDVYCHTAVRVQSGRPWLRVRATSGGTADTFIVTAQVFAVSQAA